MEPKYEYSESTVRPVSVEVGKRTVFLRKDILEEERVINDETGETVTFYVYQEAKMSHAEFNEYSSFVAAKNAIDGMNNSSNIEQLLTGQTNSDSNQLTLMEAIADLYDIILSATV